MATRSGTKFKKFITNIRDFIKSQKKEITLLFIGAIITLASSTLTTFFNNSAQEQKEIRDKKEAYVNNYIRELHRRFFFLAELFQEEGDKKVDSLNFKESKQKVDENLRNWFIDSKYDSVQFHRYFGSKYYADLKKINVSINVNVRFVESSVTEYRSAEYRLKIQSKILEIWDSINRLEEDVYKDLDKK